MKLSKKLTATLLSLLCIAMPLSACSTSTAQSGTSKDSPAASTVPAASEAKKETIRVITFFAGSDQWAPTWKEVIGEYMVQNPHITISDESVPTAGTNDVFRPKMNADIAANSPTDIAMYFNGSDSKPLLDSGMYVSWESYLDADPEWKAQFTQSALPAGECEGQLIALPYIGSFEGLVYNQKIFQAHNLEAPTTWENILKAVEVLAPTDIIPIANSLLNPTCQLETILLAEVGPEKQAIPLDDSWTAAMKHFKTLYDMGAFPKDAATISDNDTRPLLSDGRAAMTFTGSWVLNGLKANPDMRIVPVAPPPGSNGKEGSIVAGFGSGWYMSKQAAERSDESLKFIKYMCSPEILARFIQVGGSPAMQIELPAGSEPLLISANEMVSNATSMSNPIDTQMPREVFNKLAKDLVYICADQKTPQKLLEECRQLLANANVG